MFAATKTLGRKLSKGVADYIMAATDGGEFGDVRTGITILLESAGGFWCRISCWISFET